MRRLFFLVLSSFLLTNLYAQKEANLWKFGEGITLDFNTNNPMITQNKIEGIKHGKCYTSLSDKDGNSFLSIVENNLYFRNKFTTSMLIDGDTNTYLEQAQILPKPKTPNHYYIFTMVRKTFANYPSKYDQIDLYISEVAYVPDSGVLKVVYKNYKKFFENTHMVNCFNIVEMPSNAESEYVLVAHGTSGTHYAFHIDEEIISGSLISSAKSSQSLNDEDYKEGAVAINACGNQFAFARKKSYSIEIVNLELNYLGSEVRMGIKNIKPRYSLSSVVSMEYSPNGRFLYVIDEYEDMLYQYDLEAKETSRVELEKGLGEKFGDMQLAPNGKIYFTKYSPISKKSYLGVINNPNNLGKISNVDFSFNVFDENEGDLKLTEGLPTFPKHYIQSNPCFVTKIEQNKKINISISPNPFTSSIILKYIPSSIQKIQVVDMLGNVVESVDNPNYNLELGKLLTIGNYFIYLYSTNGIQIEKVVKMN